MINYKLKNGIKIVSDKVNTLDTVTLGVFISAGSKNEKTEEHGITHFIEHMLFKSNSFYKNNEAVERIERKGAIINGFTTKEYMCIYTKSLKTEMEFILDILYKMIFHPLFINEEIEIEKKVILNEIIENNENKYNIVHENLTKTLYKGHPLSRNIIGTWESIQKFEHDILMNYYNNMIRNSNIVVSLSGNIDNKLLELISNLFGSVPRNNNYNSSKVESLVPNVGVETAITYKNVKQNYLCIGYPTLSYSNNPHLLALAVYKQMLGVGQMSFLSRNIRNTLGMAYSVGAATYLFKEGGVLIINIVNDTRNDIHQVKNVLLSLLEKNFRDEINADQISTAKSQVKSSILFSLESSTSKMFQLGKDAILETNENTGSFHIDYSNTNQILKGIDNVTIEEVSAIHDGLLKNPPSVSMITPK